MEIDKFDNKISYTFMRKNPSKEKKIGKHSVDIN